MKDTANYSGGLKGDILKGLKTRSPSVNDKSRSEIGGKMSNVDSDANRSKPGKDAPTIGPRSA